MFPHSYYPCKIVVFCFFDWLIMSMAALIFPTFSACNHFFFLSYIIKVLLLFSNLSFIQRENDRTVAGHLLFGYDGRIQVKVVTLFNLHFFSNLFPAHPLRCFFLIYFFFICI